MHSAAADIVRHIGIGDRIAGRGFVQIVVDRRDDGLEVGRIFRKRCAPERPVGLRQVRAGIERHAVAQHHIPVVRDLLPRHRGRKDVQPQDAVPDEVVFLAPGPRLVEGQPVVVARRRPTFIQCAASALASAKYLSAVSLSPRMRHRSP